VVLGTGFVALSDDDYSRTVIAERFAAAPSLDPSGTSWLPLPFWIAGTGMALFGRTLGVARAVAFALGVVAALLVHRAARWQGASRPSALLGTAAAIALPTAARLGVSTQPEALTAGLLVLGAAATRLDAPHRLAGAGLLTAACLCRYEAWPAAAVFATLCVLDAWRPGPASTGASATGAAARAGTSPAAIGSTPRAPGLLLIAALIALAAPLCWMAHGALSRGGPLFFAHRVAAYRRALGGHESAVDALLRYPAAFLRTEPELVLASTVAIWIALRRDKRALARFARPALVLGSVLVFLVVGRLLDGAPTHHAERTLLPLWTGLALVAAELGAGAMRATAGATPPGDPPPHPDAATTVPSGAERAVARAPAAPPIVLVVTLLLATASAAVRVARPEEVALGRASERAIGEAARHAVPAQDRLLIDSADYGYFAVLAAFGAPERAQPVDPRDPREPPRPDPFVSPGALRSELASRGAKWIIVRDQHVAVATALGHALAGSPGFTLVALP
jgi:hypothetical protein